MKTLLFHQLGKQILLCLQVPKAVVRLADDIQLGKQRVFFSGLGKVRNGGKGQLNIGVNQLLPPGILGRFKVASFAAFKPPTWVIMAAG